MVVDEQLWSERLEVLLVEEVSLERQEVSFVFVLKLLR
jgi:hypothetical protein